MSVETPCKENIHMLRHKAEMHDKVLNRLLQMFPTDCDTDALIQLSRLESTLAASEKAREDAEGRVAVLEKALRRAKRSLGYLYTNDFTSKDADKHAWKAYTTLEDALTSPSPESEVLRAARKAAKWIDAYGGTICDAELELLAAVRKLDQ